MTSPTMTTVPATLTLPDDLAATVTARDEAFEAWADADTTLREARQAIPAAERADADALTAALKAGKADPGTKATDTARRALTIAQERQRITRQAATLADRAVTASVKAHRLDLVPQALEAARDAMTAYEEAHAEATRTLHRAGRTYTAALAGLDFLAPHLAAVIRYTVNTTPPNDAPRDAHRSQFASTRKLCNHIEQTFVNRPDNLDIERALDRRLTTGRR